MIEGPKAVQDLLTADAVRQRAHAMLHLAETGRLKHLSLHPEKLDTVVSYVADVIKENYPDGRIPYHSRLRHFSGDGHDRRQLLEDRLANLPREERLRAWGDLVTVSVLMDAGAGSMWRYRDDLLGATYSRSEGLAVASFDLFIRGFFSAEPSANPLRVDALRLQRLKAADIELGLQVSESNPLIGTSGRAMLLNQLGNLTASHEFIFDKSAPRIGNFLSWLAGTAENDTLAAPRILEHVLSIFGPIWPGRVTIGGINLGDTWPHPMGPGTGVTKGLVPFHKLSQWLTYSLIEVLEQHGLEVTDIDALTGLAEYRNGGLFLDLGLLGFKDATAPQQTYEPAHELVIEWRALTIALLDRVADKLRAKLALSAAQMPLARVLEGGTWHAGRKIARALRPDGSPPIQIKSDGTVF